VERVTTGKLIAHSFVLNARVGHMAFTYVTCVLTYWCAFSPRDDYLTPFTGSVREIEGTLHQLVLGWQKGHALHKAVLG
jgi:hypothetical protein